MKHYTSLVLVTLLTAGHAMAQSTSLEKGEKETVVEKVGDLLTLNYVFHDRAALAKTKITAALTAGDYNEIANVTRAQLPRLQAEISKLGAIKTVTFSRVGPAGLDVYDVTLANGAIQCGIFVTPDAKIVSAWIHPAAAAMPATR
jgi:hypothetical protein